MKSSVNGLIRIIDSVAHSFSQSPVDPTSVAILKDEEWLEKLGKILGFIKTGLPKCEIEFKYDKQ